MKLKLYIIGLHVFICLLIARTDRFQRLISGNESFETRAYIAKCGIHENKVLPENPVVFLGDSITEYCCLSAITENSVNGGIGGDTTEGLLHRLPIYEEAIQESKAVFVMIGVNDFLLNVDHPVEASLANYKSILERLPRNRTYVINTLPVVDPKVNKKIIELNNGLGAMGFKTIDVFGSEIEPALTRDGIHLNSKGYRKFVKEIVNVISN